MFLLRPELVEGLRTDAVLLLRHLADSDGRGKIKYMNFSGYTIKENKEIFDLLQTSPQGLSEKEAKARLEKYGFNELKMKEEGMIDIFLKQFKSPFFYLLFVASAIAFLLGERIDSAFILLFIFINVLLGFFQEARAQKAIALLKKYLPLNTKVLRGGEKKTIDKKFLVPGDIVILGPGDIAPADLRILKAENLLIDESVLSGEPYPVLKTDKRLSKETKEIFEAKNIIFAGTSVVSGEVEAVVINTGKEAVLGEITKLVSSIKKESAYERNLLNFSKLILKIVVLTIVFAFLANLIIEGASNFFDFLIFCIALIVSIIPEALPLVATFSLSEGAMKLAKQKVVARRLSAIEDLGDIEILCTDKTGTITENKLELEIVFSKDPQRCLLFGLLASPYSQGDIDSALDPFDSAIFDKAGFKIKRLVKKYKVICENPFDPSRLRNSSLLEYEKNKKLLIVRGAPETILKLSSKLEAGLDREKILKEIEDRGKKGKRTLAVAFKKFDKKEFSSKDEKDLTFIGYFSFRDPLKPTAKNAIQMAEKMGISIKIITGDSKEVAGYVAQEVGLIKNTEQVITGEYLSLLSEEQFEKNCHDFSVFARISPQMKYKIIEALQKKKEVGFLGEGINDAPALKASNLAIVVNSAVDVCREIADIVLLEKDLNVIIEGIKQGRNIFCNINKYIKCTVASNFGNFYSIVLISLYTISLKDMSFLPMLPVQILLVNLLSDFPLISVATDQVDVEELRRPKFYQFNKTIKLVIILALISTVFDFLFFYVFFFYHRVEPSLLQSLWFVESILTEIALIFSIRSSNFFIKARRPSSLLLVLSLVTIFISVSLPFTKFGQEDLHFSQPPLWAISLVMFLIVVYFFCSEAAKLAYFHYRPIKNNKKI